MQAFSDFYKKIIDSPLASWLEVLPAQLADWQRQNKNDLDKWQKLLAKLPATVLSEVDIQSGVTIGSAADIDDYTSKQIIGLLQQFKPWRKGPFHLHGIHIDTEWRSDWKWDRVLPHLSPLAGRKVLDVGCGSGYHLWRMAGEGAQLAVGVDPYPLFLMQFLAIKHFLPEPDVHMLPLGVEQLPELGAFDTVFSMGVLYHRRSPLDFLFQLKSLLRPGGELVLETLVVEGNEHTALVPGERYAQMRNVWFIPSTAALEVWLQKAGFKDIRTVDKNVTTLDEQRSTEWMNTHSLADFLDPADRSKTIEGYPAPERAVVIATR
ncbi:tRNA 5-methoxyuridine(34)/uridine 5-oxyacetic acid(34) synthase CmoB [Aliiglaciecola sp. CAU 1673]|uniref:tRNA 5-methoxyuridine(34)/uridine 5-oxyacetic acid(34) synthase CmoB n=1 Tax=Aliiglaciecola sp. CAU 1673 TaxID=3032595 RepID=UPI0023DCA680|nr:tRNA 5-methoxyuridine(34)/uridine 5-oxyacetic acid(34) synthase CmoB [Aliiglaciecola sp. CAU 1673]MDF2178120.1 tRNA 5-methoxyuridine(34)/uridine 5-oxyacetic acid(34) synthase CmoB [Aliiglaciecola sp. CAU 1673]